MKTAEGIGAWHNQYNQRPLTECVERAKRAQLDFVVVKYGWPSFERAYREAGIPWATERFVYLDQPEHEGNKLADAVDAGACFAVINAEEGGGWGPGEEGREAMRTIVDTFYDRHPMGELYTCLDTRGDRLNHPYQQAALEWCDGIMPMIYPGAFRPHQPVNYVSDAFRDALEGKDFGGVPIYPVLQSYPWVDSGIRTQMGRGGIAAQARLAQAYPGYSFYTIHHASDDEWGAVCGLKPQPAPAPSPDLFALTIAEKLLAETRSRLELIKLIADGKWLELHGRLHELDPK